METESLPDPRHPVWYFPVSTPDGDVAGYVWADHTKGEAGWTLRAHSGSQAWTVGKDWSRQLSRARERRIAPIVVMAELARAPGAGRVVGAASRDVVDALARTVTEADDRRLLAQLDAQDAVAWRELADAFDALTDEDRKTEWVGGGRRPDGVYRIPGARYSEPLQRALAALRAVGAVTQEYRWGGKPFPTVPPDGGLAPADAVRAATAIVFAERVEQGTIGELARSGLLDAAASSLRAWYDATSRTPA